MSIDQMKTEITDRENRAKELQIQRSQCEKEARKELKRVAELKDELLRMMTSAQQTTSGKK